MPKINIDYSKTVIYKIVCNDENVDYLYIGSTTNFTKRKTNHKSICNNINNINHNQKKYIEIRNNGGWENFRMIEVEKFPCNDNREAEAREEVIRLELKADMNSQRCYITDEQRKELEKEYKQKYYEANREQINIKRNENLDCECGAKYTKRNKARHIKTTKHKNYINNL